MVSTIQEVETDTGNRFNDGKCDAKGRLWAGEHFHLLMLDFSGTGV